MPPCFAALGSGQAIALAQRTLWKWYRVRVSQAEPLELPGRADPVTSLDQLLPVYDVQVEQATFGGAKVNRPAEVYGRWFLGNLAGEHSAAAVSPLGRRDAVANSSRTI